MKSMIYHYPLPLVENPRSGSQVRPKQMLQAFIDLGYNVDIVIGYSKDRRLSMRKIKNKIREGTKYDFMYCENTSMPTQLTDPHHYPLSPNLDFGFIKYLRKKNVPVGLFYRDIHWKFPFYDLAVDRYKALISRVFYKYELKFYSKNLNKFYLPTLEMAKYTPEINSNIIKALPPGHNNYDKLSSDKLEENINILYVGGLSDFYDITVFVNIIKYFPDVKLTVCTRLESWEEIKDKYLPLPDNVIVTHKSGESLKKLYRENDMALLFVKPFDYWEFAAPIKLLEYVGERKPVLVSSGIWSSKFVNKYGNGWVVEHNEHALREFLDSLNSNLILEKKEACEICANENTWLARAKEVALDLTYQRGE